MKTIQVSWNFGNFTPTVEVSIPEELEAEFLRKGALQLLQRSPATAAELAAMEAGIAGPQWPKGAKGGWQRPEGFERGSIEYSEENAMVIAEGFGDSTELKLEDGKKVKVGFTVLSVDKNESDKPEAGQMALALLAKCNSEPKYAIAVGLDESMTEPEKLAACKTFLAGLRKQK